MSSPTGRKFKIPGPEIRTLIPAMGGCYATDRITVDGMPVGYMYREEPDDDRLSGWFFFSGDETQDYADNPDNIMIYAVNTICNYDPAIIPYLDAPYGTYLGRVPGTDRFEEEAAPQEDV